MPGLMLATPNAITFNTQNGAYQRNKRQDLRYQRNKRQDLRYQRNKRQDLRYASGATFHFG